MVPAAGQFLGAATQLQPVVAVVPPPVAADHGLSSIPVVSSINCSEFGGMHDQQEPVDHCMDTTRIVSELAAALKGLEADVISLRHENRSLREAMSQAMSMPGSGNDGGVRRPPGQSSMADPKEKLSGPFPSQRAAAVATSSPPPPPMRTAPRAAAVAAQVVASAQVQAAAFRYASPRQSLPPATARLQVAPVFDGRVAIANTGAGLMEDEPDRSPLPRQQAVGLEWSDPDGQQAQEVEQQPGSANDQAVSQACQLPQWDVQQSVWIGKEGDEDRFLGKAQMRMLPEDTFVSVDQAVDCLNRGVWRCPQDFCIAYSAPDRSYFLLHRRGHRKQAEELSRLCLHNSQVLRDAQQLAASQRAAEAAQSESMPVAHLLGAACMPPQPSQTLPNSSPVLLGETAPPRLAAGVACQVPIVQAPIRHALPVQHSPPVQQVLPVQQAQLVPQTLPAVQQALPAGAAVPVVAPGAMMYAGIHDAPVEPAEEALRVGGEEFEEGRPQSASLQAEELLWQSLRNGHQPSEANFDAVILALQGEGESTRADEWLWYALESGVTPSEESFGSIVLAACRHGATEKVEDAMMQMLNLRMRPSMQIFSVVISMFTQLRDAPRVEKWLLIAGQSGWTPEQWAFEAVVLLFAERDCLKAEEWLSRAQQMEHRLPDSCYDAVVQSFMRAGNATKASEWRSRMGVERPPVLAAALTPELAMATAAPQPQQLPVDASAAVSAAGTGEGGVPPPSA